MDYRDFGRLIAVVMTVGIAIGVPIVVNFQLFMDFYSKNTTLFIFLFMTAVLVGLLAEAIIHEVFWKR